MRPIPPGRAAARLLDKLDIDPSVVPVDIDGIYAACGVHTEPMAFDRVEAVINERLRAVIRIRAQVAPDPPGPMAFTDVRMSGPERRMVLAEALARIKYPVRGRWRVSYIADPDDSLRGKWDRTFAAALLIPGKPLKTRFAAAPLVPSCAALAREFGVPVPAMKARLGALGLRPYAK